MIKLSQAKSLHSVQLRHKLGDKGKGVFVLNYHQV